MDNIKMRDKKPEDTVDAKQDAKHSTELLDDFYNKLVGRTISISRNEILLTQVLGQGSMGCVFKANMNGQDIAAKVLSPYLAGLKEFISRFANEATTMLRLPYHPHLVRGLCYGVDEKNSFEFRAGEITAKVKLHVLGMEFVDGQSLEKILADRAESLPKEYALLPDTEKKVLTKSKPLEINHACDIITQIGDALIVAHDLKKLHRDIKPANIMIKKDGTAKLTDFGLVKEFGAADQTAVGMTVGTPLYMPREQILHEFSFGSDLYSLGATLYHIITGQLPFTGVKDKVFSMDYLYHQITYQDPIPPKEINQYISEELQDIILRAMDKKIEYRQLKLREFVAELKSLGMQSFDDDVKRLWRQAHGKDESKVKVFDMIFSKDYFDLRQSITGTPKQILDECRQIEKEIILRELQYFSLSDSGLETQMRSAEQLERLIAITARTKDTVLDRVDWLGKMLSTWGNLLRNNPDLVLDKESTNSRLKWEEKCRDRLGMEKPKPPKTFWEKHGKKITAGAFVSMLLVAGGSLGHIWSTEQKRKHEQENMRIAHERVKTEFMQDYESAKQRIESYDFNNLKDLLKTLNVTAIRMGDAGLESKVETLEALFYEKQKEAQIGRQNAEAEEKIKQAYAAIDASKKPELNKEERDDLLKKAAGLSRQVESMLAALTRSDYFKREINIINGRIGPQMYAFETLDSANAKYADVKQKYERLLQEWEKSKPVSEGIVGNLRREMNGAKDALQRVERDFTDENGEQNPQYKKLTGDIVAILATLYSFDQNISFVQFNTAKAKLREVVVIIESFKNEYLSEEASGKDLQIASLEAEIASLLGNIEGSPFVWKGDLADFSSKVKATIETYKPAREKIRQVAELRSKKDQESRAQLGKILFKELAYEPAEKCFAALIESKNEELIAKHKADVYLSLIRLERKAAQEYILVRDGFSEDYVADYRRAVDCLSIENSGQTPAYALQVVFSALDALGKVPELGTVVERVKQAIQPLNTLAWDIEKLELGSAQYAAKMEEFISMANSEQAFSQAEAAAKAYLSRGSRETRPYLLLLLAEAYSEVGMKNDAVINYERFLKSSLAPEDEKEEVRGLLKKLK